MTLLEDAYNKEHAKKKENSVWRGLEDDASCGSCPDKVDTSHLRKPKNIYRSSNDRE